MSSELSEFENATVEHATELARMIALYLQAHGLRVGATLILAGADTMRTAGNMNIEQQQAAFTVLAKRLETEPDSAEMIDVTTGERVHSATH